MTVFDQHHYTGKLLSKKKSASKSRILKTGKPDYGVPRLGIRAEFVATSRYSHFRFGGAKAEAVAMQMQQHSPASSYAETDCADSDSDDSGCGDCHIPASGRRRPHPHQCVSIAEGLDLSYHADMRLLRAGRYLHKHDDDLDCEQELDEDDPAFYGNLAFFRLQCGVQLRVVRRSAHPLKAPAAPASPSAVDDRDEDIFAMEL
ncbi:hypothetical protein PR002_g21873 [Phytophthora rubi]|uniref:Uncharacterized protein n=1 Tax=Phytophthora rubi TaxID=129364 RepID=A0A6A3IYI3_9STRA|nr:hypothetical protein PR002_g21873 [Phytophthora rubi]